VRTPTDGPATDAGAEPAKRRSWLHLPEGMTPKQARNLMVISILGVVGALAFDYLLNHFVHIRPESVQHRVAGFGVWAPLVYVVALAVTVVVTPIPSLPLDIAGGLAFGLWKGTAYILLASMFGATADFYIARVFGRGLLERHLKPSVLSLIDSLAERIGGKALFVMRIEPLFNYKWVSYAAGLTSMPFVVYAVATLLGSFLPALGIAYVGDTLLSHPGRSALVLSLLSLSVVIPILAAGVIGAGVVVRRRTRRQA
jgi:uncharacterized membrane protein YdjX (TVP38/TMEM64 family)